MIEPTDIDYAKINYLNQEANNYANWMRYRAAMEGKTLSEEFITYKSEQHAYFALDNAIATNQI